MIKVHLKCDCINGSIVNGIREPILYFLALDELPGHKIFEEPGIKLFRKINKYVMSHKTFYVADNHHKPVDFNGETVSFACQLVKTNFFIINMNLDIVRLKIEKENFLLSFTRNCETLIHQTHTKSQEILEFELTKSRQTFSFKASIILGLDLYWMIGLVSL